MSSDSRSRALDLEAARRRDVLEVDAAEDGRDRLDRTRTISSAILRGEADREGVDVGELLEEHRLALHHGQRGLRADVAEPEHRGPVADDGDGVALDREVPDLLRIVGDRARDARDARRVDHREVFARLERRARLAPRACRRGGRGRRGRRRGRPRRPRRDWTAATIASRCCSSSARTLTSRIFVVPSTRTRSIAPSRPPASPIAAASRANAPGSFAIRTRIAALKDADGCTNRGLQPEDVGSVSVSTTLDAVGILVCDVGPRDGLQNEPDALAPATARRARRPARRGGAAADRGGELRARRPRAADGRRGGGRGARRAARRRRALRARAQRARLGAVRRRRARPRQRHVRGDGDLQRAERQRDARRGGRADRGDPRGGGRDARDRDGLVRVRLSVRGRGRSGRRRGARRAVRGPRRSRPRGHDRRRDSVGGARARRAATGAAGFHGHNTRNTGYANCLAALEAGATVLDASIGGLGGCPFSPRATGNVATEDLVWLLEREGVATGIDVDALVGVSRWLEELLGRTLEGYLYRASPWPS